MLKYAMTIVAGILFPLGIANAELDAETLRIVEEVSSHEYDPPRDGKITQGQIDIFVRVARRAAEIEEQTAATLLAHERDGDRSPSDGDHAHVHEGPSAHSVAVLAAVRAIAMEGGNWAEHQWVGMRLRQAMSAQAMSAAGDEASRHNKELIEANADDLGPAIGVR